MKDIGIGLKIMGIDGSLNNFGIAIGNYYDKLSITEIHVLSTSSSKDQKIYNDAKRARLIAHFLRQFDCDLVVAEMPYGTKSYSAAWSLGITLGLVTSINTPLIYVTVNEVKEVVRSHATKREIVTWAYTKYPNLQWHNPTKKLPPVAHNEHMADAIAVIHAYTIKNPKPSLQGSI